MTYLLKKKYNLPKNIFCKFYEPNSLNSLLNWHTVNSMNPIRMLSNIQISQN